MVLPLTFNVIFFYFYTNYAHLFVTFRFCSLLKIAVAFLNPKQWIHKPFKELRPNLR